MPGRSGVRFDLDFVRFMVAAGSRALMPMPSACPKGSWSQMSWRLSAVDQILRSIGFMAFNGGAAARGSAPHPWDARAAPPLRATLMCFLTALLFLR
jgi:hypothetical protein